MSGRTGIVGIVFAKLTRRYRVTVLTLSKLTSQF